jgi:alkylhydroperoxidase family enzyme
MALLREIEESENPLLEPLITRIKAERGGRLLSLYKIMLNSPPFAEGWLAFFTAVRQRAQLSGDLRELTILRIAALKGVAYEFDSHVPFAIAEGLHPDLISQLKMAERPSCENRLYSLVLAHADAMAGGQEASPSLRAELLDLLGPRQYLELTITATSYTMVAQTILALGIEHETAPGVSEVAP